MENHQKISASPLEGIRVIEFAGIGPGPFAGMMLADMGAEVIRIERPFTDNTTYTDDFLARGRQSLALDLKAEGAVDIALSLVREADALIEGFRPGVMERLGLGPDVCRAVNPGLVYGRMTGWGQDGPLSHAAGHDLNYIAITGALWACGEADRAPTFPLNLLGDFGGGGMYLAFGIVSALLKSQKTGHGDVVDASICDGTSSLMSYIHSHRAMGNWQDKRESNQLDGGTPWYSVYECADGEWVSVAALEPKFWQCLLEHLKIDPADIGDRHNRKQWPAIRSLLASTFASHTREHWVALLEGTDACFAPVMSTAEAASHPQLSTRGRFAPDGPDQPMPTPRFADAKTPLPTPPARPGLHSRQILERIGLSKDEIDRLVVAEIVQDVATDASS